jgi:hypothetical protein
VKRLFDTPRRSKSTPPVLSLVVLVLGNPVHVAQAPPMERPYPFTTFNGGNPLKITHHDDITIAFLKKNHILLEKIKPL